MHKRATMCITYLRKKIFTSSDIIFYESIFSFANTLHISPFSHSPILPGIVDNGDERILIMPLINLPSSHRPSSTHNQGSSKTTSLDLAPKCSKICHLPWWLEDFQGYQVSSFSCPHQNSHMASIKYSFQNYLFFDKFCSSWHAFLVPMSSSHESKSFPAMKYARWCDAISNEIKALKLNHTWTVMPLSLGKYAIICKQGWKWIGPHPYLGPAKYCSSFGLELGPKVFETCKPDEPGLEPVGPTQSTSHFLLFFICITTPL